MAKLTDLPAELVDRIIHHIFDQTYDPDYKRLQSSVPDHHLLDHNQINCSAKPKPRPHLDRVTPRGRRFDGRRVYHEQVSWPEGLPSNPLLPLSLVSNTFRRCAQELLFKSVALDSPWIASLFLQALTCIPPRANTLCSCKCPKNDNQMNDLEHLNPLSQHVRSLQVAWSGNNSMGRGGGSVFCEILRSCPRLENITISTIFQLACKEPILKALASNPHIKEFVILKNTRGQYSTFQWLPHELVLRLFPHWTSLETVEFPQLSGWSVGSLNPALNSAIPVLNCTLRTMILNDPQLDELEFSNLLKSCRESMRALKITGPNLKVTREALCRVLQESTSPNLECLKLRSIYCEQTLRLAHLPSSTTSPPLLEMIFASPTALKNLKTLSFEDRLATEKLFECLPKSLIKISWKRCDLSASALLKALSSSRNEEGSLPNLKCCSVAGSRDEWEFEQVHDAITKVFKARGGCYHLFVDMAYGSPIGTEERMEMEEMDDDEDEEDFVPYDQKLQPKTYIK
ncbi:hypothetical protein PCANC_11146 [Puccinia coronata f. sp. avenae]|uniref:F-box domain-containing protein n=1 Tax=Puccinia coronata f. sp. avenae TaxID=200324 RepID=A0A2N5URP5_9BASI|nr:hypothetical protein PCANC_11146 [Puccinia coronata f. sp. avenae]